MNPTEVRIANGVLHPDATPRSWGPAILLLTILVVGGLLFRLADASGLPHVSNFLLVTASMLVEAIPFVFLGAVVGAAIEGFVPMRAFERVAHLPTALQLPLAGLGGFAFPVCECGSVPVARRLLLKGLKPAAAITFMLAAPVVNPVVLWATAIAYQGRGPVLPMVLGRAGLALGVAMIVGVAVGPRARDGMLARTRGDDFQCRHCGEQGHLHDHLHGHGSKADRFLGQASRDFLVLSKYLIVGASVAGALQTFVPQSVLGSLAAVPVLSILAMMVLAALLSLCSESDAFVAASFVQFGYGPQLGFLVFGPMVDTKLGFLYAGAFGSSVLKRIAALAFAATFVGTLVIEVLFL